MIARRPLPLWLFAAAALCPVALLACGLCAGGGWLWVAFLYMALLTTLLDQMIPLTAGAADGDEFPAAEALLVGIAAAQFTALPLATWAIAGDSGLDPAERILTFLATGFWFGQVAHPAAHELIHRSRRDLFGLGIAIYTSLLFGHHGSAHRLVHHRHVASAGDPNTARSGESFYRFALRAWRDSFVLGLWAETALRARTAQHALHPYAFYLSGSLICLALGGVIAGPAGVIVWAALALHAQSQILLSDYVQHYGLARATLPDGRLEPVGLRHSWNAPHWFSSAMMLNAPRHSDHHAHPARPFPALRLPDADDAPRLPWPLPVAGAIALFPRRWHRALRPHLARWQRQAPAQDTAA